MHLILNGLPPLHWAVAGAAIAAITLALLAVGNRRLGISTGFEDVCSLVLPHRISVDRPSLMDAHGGFPFSPGC